MRGPFHRGVENPGACASAERVDDGQASGVRVFVQAVFGAVIEPGHPASLAGGIANVTPEVNEQRIAAEAVTVAAVAREALPIARLGAELDEGFGRREPFQLHAVLRELATDEGLIDQGLIDEVPRVSVNLVEITDAGEEPPAFSREAVMQR